MAYGTSLAELLVKTRAEARHSANAGAGLNSDATLRQMLSRIQETEYLERDWRHMRVRRDISTVADERIYDWPADLAFDRATHAWVQWGNEWRLLSPGIDESHYNHLAPGVKQDPPRQWDRTEDNKIELWPTPATAMTFRLCGIKSLSPLVADGDTADLDDVLLYLLAAAELLALQKAPDAGAKLTAANRRRNALIGSGDKKRSYSFLSGQMRGFGGRVGSRLHVVNGQGSITWDGSAVWGP